MMSCLAVQMLVPIFIHSISLLITQKMKNTRKTVSMTRVSWTTHFEIRVTYCRVVAFRGSLGGAAKAQVIKKANKAEKGLSSHYFVS